MLSTPPPRALLFLFCAATVPACVAEDADLDATDATDTDDDARDEDEDEQVPRIFGASSFDNCLPSEEALMRDSVRLGKWLLTTPEFASCVQNAGYGACDEDDVQTIPAAMAAAQSINDYEVTCDWLDDDVLGSAYVDSWANAGTEEINVDIDYLTQQLALRPFSGQAGVGMVLWHELMHQHGFEHGNSSAANPAVMSAENRATCGQSNTWVWNQHSMPYLMGECFMDTALGITNARLAASGYTGQLLNDLTRLIEISLSIGGIVNENQYASTQIAVAWRRKMRAQHSMKCMGVVGGSMADNALVQQTTCINNDNAQRWVAMPIQNNPANGDPRYVIMNVQSGKCLDRPWGNVANNTVLQQYTCHGLTPQQFRRRATGQYEAMTPGGASNQCLDIASESQANGATLQMSTCKAANSPTIANQVFSMVF